MAPVQLGHVLPNRSQPLKPSPWDVAALTPVMKPGPCISGLCMRTASDLGRCILVQPGIDSSPFPGPQSPHSLPAGCPGDLPPSPPQSPSPSSGPSKPPHHTELCQGHLGLLTPTLLRMLFQSAIPATGPVMKAMSDPGPSHPSQDWINVPRQWPLPCCVQTSPHSTHTVAPRGTVSE